MRNLIDAYARAVGAWAQNLSANGLNRTVRALDDMRNGAYGTERFTTDLYEYWRDVADFRAQTALGIFPIASLDIPAWTGTSVSNFVSAPVVPLANLVLTPVVNPVTQTALSGLQLHANSGENAVRVLWVRANAGNPPTGADKAGLFHGAIYRTDNGELVATVYAITRLP